MEQMTLLIRKGTTVWVGKDLTSDSLSLFRHTMKRDLAVPYPSMGATAPNGPKVVSLSREVESIREPQLTLLKLFVISNTPGPKNPASLLELLEAGYDVFVTENETYPLLIVHSGNVDEVDETPEGEWDIEDLGDGLEVRTRTVPCATCGTQTSPTERLDRGKPCCGTCWAKKLVESMVQPIPWTKGTSNFYPWGKDVWRKERDERDSRRQAWEEQHR